MPEPTATARAAAAVGPREQLAGLLEQRRAGRSQRDTAPVAFEELDAQLGLERAHLLAHARLREMQSLGRAAEVQLLGHGDERAQMPELHAAMIGNAYH